MTVFNLISYQRLRNLSAVTYVMGFTIVCFFGYFISGKQLDEQLQRERALVEDTLSSSLTYYQFVPSLLKQSGSVLSVLINPTEANISAINLEFERLNNELGSDVIYLLDDQGVTVASSNHKQPDSFVSDDYSFRPYYREAINTGAGHYLALGIRSGKRGYFFSSSVTHNGKSIGVIVIKISLNHIEEIWQKSGIEFLVFDRDGIVFFSSRSDWLYKSLLDHSVEKLRALNDTQRYGPNELKVVAKTTSNDLNTVNEIFLGSGEVKKHWQINQTFMPSWDLNVATLVPFANRYLSIVWYLFTYTVLFLLLHMYWLYLDKKRELRVHLQDMNRRLENQVNELTQDLQVRNQQLQESAIEQEHAHKALQQAQAELVQTAKLAVLGEFSAGLHHELTQPLQALRSYANNSLRMMELKKTRLLEETLRDIVSVTDSMVKIVQQFRIFARRSQPESRPCGLSEIISAALSIVRPELEKKSVKLINQTTDSLVFCEPVLIEQVIVNLISNAVHALNATESPKISLSNYESDGYLWLEVCDNGPGVDANILENLFEPFFTTRDSGLGLGLAIAKRIVESQGGSIKADLIEQGGLRLVISLPIHTKQNH